MGHPPSHSLLRGMKYDDKEKRVGELQTDLDMAVPLLVA